MGHLPAAGLPGQLGRVHGRCCADTHPRAHAARPAQHAGALRGGKYSAGEGVRIVLLRALSRLLIQHYFYNQGLAVCPDDRKHTANKQLSHLAGLCICQPRTGKCSLADVFTFQLTDVLANHCCVQAMLPPPAAAAMEAMDMKKAMAILIAMDPNKAADVLTGAMHWGGQAQRKQLTHSQPQHIPSGGICVRWNHLIRAWRLKPPHHMPTSSLWDSQTVPNVVQHV